jgi:hypothetical protein
MGSADEESAKPLKNPQNRVESVGDRRAKRLVAN